MPHLLGRNTLKNVGFLVQTITSKSPFEINWPLRTLYCRCICKGAVFALKWPNLGQHDPYIGWDSSIPTSSINTIFMEDVFLKVWSKTIHKSQIHTPNHNSPRFSDSYKWKLCANDGVAWMGLNLYDYHGSVPIYRQYRVLTTLQNDKNQFLK